MNEEDINYRATITWDDMTTVKKTVLKLIEYIKTIKLRLIGSNLMQVQHRTHTMNDRIKELMFEAGYAAPEIAGRAQKLAELVRQDVIDQITVVRTEQGEVVAVTLTDEEHRIQQVIWQKETGK